MGFIDIHSHILPNMDDGSRSIFQSLEMLKIASRQGITVMIATPHNMPGKGCPDREVVFQCVKGLQEQADRENIPIRILAGTEYFYREDILELLEEETAITLADSECVLVEFDPFAERTYIRNALRNILGMGYTPVIAHVERYVRIMEEKGFLRDLRLMGVLVQVNAASVTGDNGGQAKKDAKQLLKEHLVDFVGTDAHSDGRRAPYMEKCAKILYRRYGWDYASALLYGNAEHYLMKGTV